MDPMTTYAIIAASALAAVSIIALVALTGFRGWLDLKRAELGRQRAPAQDSAAQGPATVNSRIELADLKERVRKLEAIAAGVDL